MSLRSQIDGFLHNKMVRNGALFSLYSFFEKGCAFLMTIVLAKFIAPDEYGLLSLFITVMTFFGYVVSFSTDGYLSISYFRDSREEFRRVFTTIISVTFGASLLLLVGVVPFAPMIAEATGLDVLFVYLALAVAFARTFHNVLLNYLRVQERVGLYGLFSCSNAILFATLAVVLVVPVGLGWEGSVYAQLAVPVLFAAIAMACFVVWRLFDFTRFSWRRVGMLLAWSIPLIPHMAAIWLRQGADRLIIKDYHTLSDVGLFSFALTLTGIIIMVGTAFNNTFSVNLFQTLSSELSAEDKVRTLRRQTRRISMVYVAATLGIVAFVMLVVPFAVSRYVGALPYFAILAGYGLLQCIYFQYCNYLFYYKRTRQLMYITFGTSLLHVALSFVLTPLSLYFTCGIYIFIQALIVLLVYHESQRLIKENVR